LMGTAERHGAAGTGVAVIAEAQRDPQAPDHDIPAEIPAVEVETDAETEADIKAERNPKTERDTEAEADTEAEEQEHYRPLWIEEPEGRRRLPDPVRASAVRAVIIIAITLIQAMVAFLCTLAGSWLAFPMVLSSVASTVVATWGALDVWVTRQVWNQRNGVVSVPSSTARALRRERRRARRQERATERAKERIRRQGGGAGQLSHS
jgi:hypothetical protein